MTIQELAIRLAGIPWIAYCSNLEEALIRELVESDMQLPRSCQAALDLIVPGLERAIQEANPENPGGGYSLPFVSWLRIRSMSVSGVRSDAATLRAEAGGEVRFESLEDTGNGIVDLLTQACLEAFPAGLIPSEASTMVRWELPPSEASRSDDFGQLAMRSELASLFPQDAVAPSSDGSAFWFGPSRNLNPVHPRSLLDNLRRVTFLRVMMLDGSLSEDSIVLSAAQVCADVRALAAGRVVPAPAVALLNSIDLSGVSQGRVVTALGLIRPSTAFDMDHLGVNLQSSVGWPRQSAKYVSTHACTAVVESPDEIRVRPVDGARESSPLRGMPDFYDEHISLIHGTDAIVSERLRLLRLAIALSGAQDGTVVEAGEMARAFVRISSRADDWQGSNEPLPPWASEVDDIWSTKVRRWAYRISVEDMSGMSLAVERILSAAHRTGSDGLVDAVVAWEAVLGGSENTSFRVRTGLAICIEPVDIGARREVQRRAGELYSYRSHLVHGSPLKSGRLQRLRGGDPRREAIVLGLRLIGAIILQWRSTLSMTPEERSNEILLKGATDIPLVF